MDTEKQVDFSIIIPVQKINEYILETCQKLKNLENKSFEVIIFPDEPLENYLELEKELGARIIATGKVGPAIKRDFALTYAKGKNFAFIDDDAYPAADWLDVAGEYLEHNGVAAVGGPQLTPPEDNFWQKVSGAMFVSILSGNAVIRYWPGKKVQEVEDWPAVNFIIKREAFEKVGGFRSEFWPGEDTKLCLHIVKQLNQKILYIPQLVVYHHRRSGLWGHLKQAGNYGLHRGFFARVLPETSMKLVCLYFMPSIFFIFLVVGLFFSLFSSEMELLYLTGLIIYCLALIVSSLLLVFKTKNFLVSVMTIPYLFLFHLWYGLRFIQGYAFTRKLQSKLGK